MRYINFIVTALCLTICTLCYSCGKLATPKPFVDGPTTVSDEPPLTWKEHWIEHNETLKRVFFNDEIVVYIDGDVDTTYLWLYQPMTDIWKYTKKTYGEMGSDKRLYIVLHGGKYGDVMGRYLPYFDSEADYHNVVDVSAAHWDNINFLLPVVIHETGHVVESATNGVKGSPSYALWQDSKWQDIYIYDALMNNGLTERAEEWVTQYNADFQDYPRSGSQWFKNWWIPIYSKYGKGALLSNYFELLAKNFPKTDHPKGYEFTRDLNWGEFVHFWSGAAGVDLKEQFTFAFGWSDEWEAQYRQAKIDFPKVTYK